MTELRYSLAVVTTSLQTLPNTSRPTSSNSSHRLSLPPIPPDHEVPPGPPLPTPGPVLPDPAPSPTPGPPKPAPPPNPRPPIPQPPTPPLPPTPEPA
jgi:hypothetical protein